MKKIMLAVALSFALALAFTACSSAEPDDQPATEEEAQAGVQEEAEQQTGMPNPWSDVESADAAARGAGIDGFAVADDLGMDDWQFAEVTYRCMDGIAEADFDGGAFEVCVRKSGSLDGVELSGDYNDYPYEWTQDCDGITVTCRGYEEGQASAFDWKSGANTFSVLLVGLGGENMSVDADGVEAIVSSVQ